MVGFDVRGGEANGKVARMHCNRLLHAARPHTLVGKADGADGKDDGGRLE